MSLVSRNAAFPLPVLQFVVSLMVAALLSAGLATRPGWPDWLAVFTLFWVLRAPRYFGLIFAWSMGLVLDVLNGSLLGTQALALTVAVYVLQLSQTRISLFPVWQQSVAMLIPFGVFELIQILSVLFTEPTLGIGWYWLAVLSNTLGLGIWLLVFRLQAPKRQQLWSS